ncbi:FAD:protein FMN transferase [Algiphilus sp.]|uniref:FAD:protein FMN transferase n=1 Tax=Algiphilus sp. TaxID=1872431 RepID=UPI003B52FF4C
MLLRRILFGGVALVLLTYLLFRPPPPGGEDQQLVQEQFAAMGTWFTVSIWLDTPEQRPAAQEAVRGVERALHAYTRRWQPEGEGALGALNAQLAEGAVIDVPEDMQPLFAQAAQWRARSGGAFDARVGALVELWGFHLEEAFRDTPPPDAAIRRIRQQLAEAPVYDGPRYGPAPGVIWNFGAIAKGDAVAQASDRLKAAGFGNHIVNAGGDLVVRGSRSDRAWRIAVRHPRPSATQQLLAAIEVEDEAVFTSGDYERWFTHEGTRYHHILDPATGQPARGLQSVTVVTDSGVDADAASTALFVAGDEWRQMARQLGMDTVVVVYDDGTLGMTEAARARFNRIADAELRPAP